MKKKELETELVNVVQKYRIHNHKRFEPSLQLAIQQLQKHLKQNKPVDLITKSEHLEDLRRRRKWKLLRKVFGK